MQVPDPIDSGMDSFLVAAVTSKLEAPVAAVNAKSEDLASLLVEAHVLLDADKAAPAVLRDPQSTNRVAPPPTREEALMAQIAALQQTVQRQNEQQAQIIQIAKENAEASDKRAKEQARLWQLAVEEKAASDKRADEEIRLWQIAVDGKAASDKRANEQARLREIADERTASADRRCAVAEERIIKAAWEEIALSKENAKNAAFKGESVSQAKIIAGQEKRQSQATEETQVEGKRRKTKVSSEEGQSDTKRQHESQWAGKQAEPGGQNLTIVNADSARSKKRQTADADNVASAGKNLCSPPPKKYKTDHLQTPIRKDGLLSEQ